LGIIGKWNNSRIVGKFLGIKMVSGALRQKNISDREQDNLSLDVKHKSKMLSCKGDKHQSKMWHMHMDSESDSSHVLCFCIIIIVHYTLSGKLRICNTRNKS